MDNTFPIDYDYLNSIFEPGWQTKIEFLYFRLKAADVFPVTVFEKIADAPNQPRYLIGFSHYAILETPVSDIEEYFCRLFRNNAIFVPTLLKNNINFTEPAMLYVCSQQFAVGQPLVYIVNKTAINELITPGNEIQIEIAKTFNTSAIFVAVCVQYAVGSLKK